MVRLWPAKRCGSYGSGSWVIARRLRLVWLVIFVHAAEVWRETSRCLKMALVRSATHWILPASSGLYSIRRRLCLNFIKESKRYPQWPSANEKEESSKTRNRPLFIWASPLLSKIKLANSTKSKSYKKRWSFKNLLLDSVANPDLKIRERDSSLRQPHHLRPKPRTRMSKTTALQPQNLSATAAVWIS